MPDWWEQCRICGEEWRKGTRVECPYYRNGQHRRQRTNSGEDVVTYDKQIDSAPIPPPEPSPASIPEPPPENAPRPSGPRESAVDISRLEIVIVGHSRPLDLQAAINGWAATTPGYRGMVVIGNHPDTLKGITLVDRAIPVQTGRIPSHGGKLSESWNLGLLWTFIQHPETEWVILSQDDVRVQPGWQAVVNSYDADFYNAPAGDMIMLMSRKAFQQVGWFDEHLCTIGGQDLDWIARAVIRLGEYRIVSEDHHGWTYNPIGLAKYWESSKGGATPGASYLSGGHVDARLKEYLRAKWGVTSQELHNSLVAHRVPTPVMPEYDWYPWCTR